MIYFVIDRFPFANFQNYSALYEPRSNTYFFYNVAAFDQLFPSKQKLNKNRIISCENSRQSVEGLWRASLVRRRMSAPAPPPALRQRSTIDRAESRVRPPPPAPRFGLPRRPSPRPPSRKLKQWPACEPRPHSTLHQYSTHTRALARTYARNCVGCVCTHVSAQLYTHTHTDDGRINNFFISLSFSFSLRLWSSKFVRGRSMRHCAWLHCFFFEFSFWLRSVIKCSFYSSRFHLCVYAG